MSTVSKNLPRQPYQLNPIPEGILSVLNGRSTAGTFRTLSEEFNGSDFCSNDYLGLAARPDFLDGFPGWWEDNGSRLGATGSRLVSGNHPLTEELESYLSTFHEAHSSLLFSSGYEANCSLLSAIGRRTDTILYDEFVHASMRDGVRLSVARSRSFRHNDIDDLRKVAAASKGDIYVAVESLYSMHGDFSPLVELCHVCREIGAYLIVDEAHSNGVFGAEGKGIAQSLGLQELMFARVHTFGKALGFRGACVLGSSQLRTYLTNIARPFVYSTGPDLFTIWAIRRAYSMMIESDAERSSLAKFVLLMKEMRTSFPALPILESDSQIQGILLPGNKNVLQMEELLRGKGFNVRAIRSPTVPVGSERIRICLHAFNKISEIRSLFEEAERFYLRTSLT